MFPDCHILRAIIYSLSLQKKGNYRQKEYMKNQKNRTIEQLKYNSQDLWGKYLLNPVRNHCPIMRAFLQHFAVCKHRIPFRTEVIVPEEIPHQLWSCIFKDGSTTVNCRTCLLTDPDTTSEGDLFLR